MLVQNKKVDIRRTNIHEISLQFFAVTRKSLERHGSSAVCYSDHCVMQLIASDSVYIRV
jgi:hypothetical protein